MLAHIARLHKKIVRDLSAIVADLEALRLQSKQYETILLSPVAAPKKAPRPPRFVSDTNRVARQLFASPPSLPPPLPPPGPQLIFYDLETTGLGATDKIGIREIGAAVMHGNDFFRRAVKPLQDITVGALRVAPLAPDAATARPWNLEGPNFYAWVNCRCAVDEPQPQVYLAGYNSKRFDSRILMFENQRHEVSIEHLSPAVQFVDMMEVVRALEPDIDKPRTLARVHQNLVGNAITSAHTALGDTYALKDIGLVLEERHGARFWHEIKNRAESLHGVMKRCKLN